MCTCKSRLRLCIRIGCAHIYLSHFIVFVLLCFYQKTPLDVAAEYRCEEVVAYLKRAADPTMLEVRSQMYC